jgi:hypothetical protein
MGSTATQIVFSYPAPQGEGYCTINASTSYAAPDSWGPMATDVDSTIFASANVDLERPSTISNTNPPIRTVVLGQRTAQLNSANKPYTRHYSRALQAATTYHIGVDCSAAGTTSSVLTAATTNIPLGGTFGDPWLSDPAHPGDQPFPESIGGLTPEAFNDPMYGTHLYRIGLRGNNPQIWNLPFGSAFNQGQLTPCDSAGPWTSPCAVTAGSGSTTVGNSTAPLVLRPPMSTNDPWNTNYGSFWSLDQAGVSLTGSVNSSTPAFCVLDICLSLNGGPSCASPVLQMTMGQTSSQQTVGEAPTSIWVPTQFGVDPWVLDTTPRLNAQESSAHSGTATVTNNGGTYTVTNNDTGDLFSLYWIDGGNGSIRLSSNNDACVTPPANTTSTESRISSFANGSAIVLAAGSTPPTGTNIYWCENNFTLMVWRDQAPTDGSTVTLTAAVLNILGSYAPFYPDNGADTACFNKQVFGGYFCLYGNLYWVNPVGPVVAYYGQPAAAGVDGSGNPIANSWTRVTAPPPESASIDQTQTNFTFYMVGTDPAGASPLVIQGVFNPGTTPSQPTVPQAATGIPQIQNATVSSTTPYSVTWNNGLTFTNLTPQTSMPESIVQQMARFDPTFLPSYYEHSATGGWNCSLEGAMSTAVFFLGCNSIGSDSPGWIFAFAPGNGIAADAGAAAGPRIIGAINTFNTPPGPVSSGQGALTGRSIHAFTETGETGWLAIDGNQYEPINTSNTSVPPSGVSCATYGLPSGNDCFLIQINSYTVGNVTGYEPYFASPSGPFLGTPGELRTTQIGDTACITTITAGFCNWIYQANELATLEIKNYESVDGAWIFRRKTYGAELPATGPIALWWASYQSLIPPGGTPQSQAVQVFWNPLAGCSGSPDPHGNCLIMDTNENNGHGEWRDGGEAEAVNVPNWGQTNYEWPTGYQTIVGSVPTILGFPFADDLPNPDTYPNPYPPPQDFTYQQGVNYTSTNPGFACDASVNCTYGAPWGSDAGAHPNPAAANDPNNASYAFDNIPVQGGMNDPGFSPVTGQLYKATPVSADPDNIVFASSCLAPPCAAPINRKVVATGASCGSHPLIDLSNPTLSTPTTSTITGDIAQSYTYCVTRAGEECYPGSVPGEIYVNCPGVIPADPQGSPIYCSGSAVHGGIPLGVGNDICVGNIGASANAIRQFALSPPGGSDLSGAYTRTLVSATSRLRMVTGFENNRLLPHSSSLPDSSWLLFRAEFLNYQRQDMWMALIPSYPATDVYNLGQFIPEAMTVPSYSGADSAVIEFGYQENGLPAGYSEPAFMDCTTRHDPCWANAAQVGSPPYSDSPPPFYFKSEMPAGMPCPAPAGCTISVPAISQRTLFYRVLYFSGTRQVAQSGIAAVSVP